MKFYRFTVLKNRKDEDLETGEGPEETLLLNSLHIVSIKPIRMILKGAMYQGYWLRTSNGKKYRALEIPVELKSLLDEKSGTSEREMTLLSDDEQITLVH